LKTRDSAVELIFKSVHIPIISFGGFGPKSVLFVIQHCVTPGMHSFSDEFVA